MTIREIIMQAVAVGIGFIGGVLYTREIYLPLVRKLKEYERRA